MNSQHTEIPPAAEVPAVEVQRSKDHQPTREEVTLQHHTRSCNRIRPGTKRADVLRAFLDRGERGLNCFEAANQLHDYVLRSTVSELAREHGLTFTRKWETVPGHNGTKTECVRYWLSACDVEKVRALIGLEPVKAAPDLSRASAEVRKACRHWEALYAAPKVTPCA